jgi:transcriptional regulator with XRE-family HTH domain
LPVEGWRGRLRLAIQRSGLTHAEVARRASIAPETLSRIINDLHTHPQFETVARIASATRVRVGWLLEEPVRGIEFDEKERATIRAAGVILFDAMRR